MGSLNSVLLSHRVSNVKAQLDVVKTEIRSRVVWPRINMAIKLVGVGILYAALYWFVRASSQY